MTSSRCDHSKPYVNQLNWRKVLFCSFLSFWRSELRVCRLSTNHFVNIYVNSISVSFLQWLFCSFYTYPRLFSTSLVTPHLAGSQRESRVLGKFVTQSFLFTTFHPILKALDDCWMAESNIMFWIFTIARKLKY